MLHFFEKGQGHPLLLLHGFCESGEMWRYFADSLSTQYRVICPDLPGFGASALTHPFQSLEEVAEQMEGWMQAEQIQGIESKPSAYFTPRLLETIWTKRRCATARLLF